MFRLKPSYVRGAGWGGGPNESFDDIHEEHRHFQSDGSDDLHDKLNGLVDELGEIVGEGTSSKPHKITTPAREKPKKREYIFEQGEKTLKPIPLQTKALADFVDDPLVPHAYLVKTA
jgi:hypothetical protein